MCHLMSFYVATALSSHEKKTQHFICLLQEPIKCKTHAVGSGTAGFGFQSLDLNTSLSVFM